jgi:hypothetical protein
MPRSTAQNVTGGRNEINARGRASAAAAAEHTAKIRPPRNDGLRACIAVSDMEFDSRESGSMQLGLYTFGELTPHWSDGRRISARQRLQEILAAAKHRGCVRL